MLLACSSAPSRSAPSTPTPPSPPDAAVAIDAAPDAGTPQAVLDAPAWAFTYTTEVSAQSWTLQYADGQALLVVASSATTVAYDTPGPADVYVGSATQNGESLALDVTSRGRAMKLECKRARRSLSRKCNDTKAKAVDVLDCYHPDYKQPMPFGAKPGIEYVVATKCYRLAGP